MAQRKDRCSLFVVRLQLSGVTRQFSLQEISGGLAPSGIRCFCCAFSPTKNIPPHGVIFPIGKANNLEEPLRHASRDTSPRQGRSTLDLKGKVIFGASSLQEKLGIYINKLRNNTTVYHLPLHFLHIVAGLKLNFHNVSAFRIC
jgi:hypothetical protein